MKFENVFYGCGTVLVVNYLLHQMFAPALYFGIVLCGIMIYYRHAELNQMMEDALVRFILILVCSFLSDISMNFLEAFSWFVLCAFSSGAAQRIEGYSIFWLEKISIINICLIGTMVCLVLLSSLTGLNISQYVMLLCALFQPSHLPCVNLFEGWSASRTL